MTGGDDHDIELGVVSGLVEKRNIRDSRGRTGGQRREPAIDGFVDGRMDDFLERAACVGIAEDDGAKRAPIHAALVVDDFFAEACSDSGDSRRRRCEDIVRKPVRIDRRHAAPGQ